MQEHWLLWDPGLVPPQSPCKTGKVIADDGELALHEVVASVSLPGRITVADGA